MLFFEGFGLVLTLREGLFRICSHLLRSCNASFSILNQTEHGKIAWSWLDYK